MVLIEKLASWLSTKLYDVIINDSFEMQNIYKDLFNADSTVIAYGANIRYSNNPSLINKWALEKDNYYLIVGRLIPDNNADLIIKEFISSRSSKKLVIVGDVPYDDTYVKRVKSIVDDRLIFTGYITDQNELAELYHNCFAYFHGHEYGGTNPTMLKALAYGCGIISLKTPFTLEMCDNGKYAIYFTKEEGYLQNIIDKIENDSGIIDSLRCNSRSRVIQNYTWEKITDQYIDLFKKMVSTKSINFRRKVYYI